jgi:hypothetical protein
VAKKIRSEAVKKIPFIVHLFSPNKKTLLKAESLSPVVPNNKNFKTVDEI